MEELLKDLISGDDDEQDEAAGLGVLGGILGGLGGGAQTSSLGLDDALGNMLGGAQAPAAQAPAAPPQSSGLGGLLGGILGGGNSGLGGILGSVLGGGSQAQAMPGFGASPAMGGIADALAKKLGVSPQVASMIMTFAVTMLLQAVQRRSAQRQGLESEDDAAGLDLSDLLKGLGGRQPLKAEQIMSTGMPQQLAEQTGLDVVTAERGLEEALTLLGTKFGGQQPASDAVDGRSADTVM